jgi:hypothetical protein
MAAVGKLALSFSLDTLDFRKVALNIVRSYFLHGWIVESWRVHQQAACR